ncbi:hypothetical protein [Pararhodobacter sp.]|uniref:HTH-like domain-containing protein n=1 Tax=Pararhodobacter sp. TaxID=2127056 RepID=UPI002AFE2829|nr:hypothetical protein [Pararhodobacter sp.]
MRADDLSTEFGKRSHAAANGMKAVTIHLFGIEFAAGLEGHNLPEICAGAGVPTSYGTELRKGMRLAEFENIK